jgi:AcrR family transcriptional regulator
MSTKDTPAVTAPQPAPAVGGLRARKKQQTRDNIRRHAYRLFAEQGYEATTVDQIAAAAEVSPSTFFRYFPAKEDVVHADDYNPKFAEALRARPADEPVMESVRVTIADSFDRILGSDREELLLRARLTLTDPAVRAGAMDEQLRSQAAVAEMISERTGRPADDLDVSVTAASIIAVSMAVVYHWAERDGVPDLAELYERQFARLAEGLRF